MTWNQLTTKASREYYAALFLNRLVSFSTREKIHKVVTGLFVFTGLLSLILLVLPFGTRVYDHYAYGVFCFATIFWLKSVALRAFYFSYYFKSIPDDEREIPVVSFELAELLYRTDPDDLIGGLIKTEEGILVLRRSGIFASDVKQYINNRTTYVLSDTIVLPDTQQLSFTQYCEALYAANKEFADILFARGIQKNDFLAICDWVIEREVSFKKQKRWWAREKLGRIPGIGKAWNYGKLFELEKYERFLPRVATADYDTHAVFGTDELRNIESILVKQHEANVFLVGNNIDEKLQIIARLEEMIEKGKAFPELEHKRIFALDTELISATAKTKNDMEQVLLALMKEAAEAGNIILVFPDFPVFLRSGDALGLDLISFLDPYFTSPELQIIALSDTDRYHSQLERNPALMERFDTVLLKEIDIKNSLYVLQNEIIALEQQHGLFFTYTAIASIVMTADRYITTGVMPDKAIDLLQELAPKMLSLGRMIVRKEDVEELVHLKTGIPVGQVTEEERDKLLGLEQVLHKRVIGQDEAISAIAQAVRRARSGINNPNRPMASFLFLGPTGVGKTETTKALADVFFGTESMIDRLDMSEFSGADALTKLIGSFGTKGVGILSSMVRERPYGVLLLDEFEKTTPEVMNLFLQILDEGFFSDMEGKRINARNLIIIATSNAGADLIWDALKKGNDLSHAKELIVDSLVQAHVFKPELLNRFDGVIIFHPLGVEQLEKVARIQLESLSKRIAERGLKLVITDDLVRYVLKYGTDPKFGARPMARAVQDKVEQVIADKLIRGEATPGSEIRIVDSDLT